MPDYAQLRSVCKESSALSKAVIDDFLIPYAAQRERLDREMDIRFGQFKKVIRDLQPGWINLFKAQYIGHRIFRKGGLINKYLNHAAFRQLSAEERKYMTDEAEVAWRFSFSVITAIPEPDFYEMEDVFSGVTFLLFSPSISQTLAEGNASLWFNLIGFNGHCWQSFGPVLGFRSFAPDDIFFFATELNARIESEEELLQDLEENPVPYMMLITGSNYPAIVNGQDEMIQVTGGFPLFSFDGTKFKKDFEVGYSEHVYRLQLINWAEPPHFAIAYFSEEENKLLLTALTDRGYEALAQAIRRQGLDISAEPDIRLHLPMITCIKSILGKELELNPYEELFNVQSSPREKADLDRLNQLLSLALPYINAGEDPDIPALAKEAGVDEESAREVLNQMVSRMKVLRQKKAK